MVRYQPLLEPQSWTAGYRAGVVKGACQKTCLLFKTFNAHIYFHYWKSNPSFPCEKSKSRAMQVGTFLFTDQIQNLFFPDCF